MILIWFFCLKIATIGTFCGTFDSCSNWIYHSSPYFTYTLTSVNTYNLAKGYNRIEFAASLQVKKGQMLFIYSYTANLLGINTTDDSSILSDYYITSTSSKIRLDSNWRFYANVLIDKTYYQTYLRLNKTFKTLRNQSFEVSNISAKFDNSNISINRYFNVSNGKNFHFQVNQN